MTIYEMKENRRLKMNQKAYDSLKVRLTYCPSFEFNRYVLSFAKTFIKYGSLKVQKKNGSYTLLVHNREYEGYVMIQDENEKKEITISISPLLINATQNMTKKVIFDEDTITVLFKSRYEDTNSRILESSSCSMFKNTCSIDFLKENNLVYRELKETQESNNQMEEKLESIIVKKDGTALVKKWDSKTQHKEYFKLHNINTSFEDLLAQKPISLNEEEISQVDATILIDEWLKENYSTKEKLKKII